MQGRGGGGGDLPESVLQKGPRIYIRRLHTETLAFKQRYWDFEGDSRPGLPDYISTCSQCNFLFMLSVLVWI